MPSYTIDIPGQGTYRVDSPTELSDYQAYHAAQKQVEAEQAAQKAHEKKTGFFSAVSSGFHEAKGAAEQALGEVTGNKKLKDWAKENITKAQTEHEATTAEDVKNAKGMFDTAGKFLTKNVSEPLGGILGSYGAPLAVGAAAAALAPEAAIGGAGAAALEGLAGEELLTATAAQLAKREAAKRLVGATATTAAAAPSEMGRNLEAQEAAHPGAAHNLATAALMSIPQAALVGFGMPGTKYINRLVPELVPAAQKLVPQIESGAITAEAAKKELSGVATQYLRGMAANTAAGTGMMVGTEELRRIQAGQDLMSGKELLDTFGTAAALSPIFAAFHPSDRAAAHEILTTAENQRKAKLDTEYQNTYGGTEAEVADADAQRAADLEGLKGVNDVFNVVRRKADNNKRIVENILSEGKLESQVRANIDAHPDVKALDTIEGTKKFLKELKGNKGYTEEEKKVLRPQVVQYLQTLKQKNGIYEKLTPKQQVMANIFEAHQTLREAGIDPTADFSQHPIDTLNTLKEGIGEYANDPSLSKVEQHKVGYLSRWIDKAINEHPETKRAAGDEEFNRVLELKRAKEAELTEEQRATRTAEIDRQAEAEKLQALAGGPEARAAYLAKQEVLNREAPKAEIPAEAFPAEMTQEQKLAQTVRSTARARTAGKSNQAEFEAFQREEEQRYKEENQQAQADAFYMERQKPSAEDIARANQEALDKQEPFVPAVLSKEEAGKGVVNEVPGQGNLFTPKTGQPTKAAESTAAARLAEEQHAVRSAENESASSKPVGQGSKSSVGVSDKQQPATKPKAGGAGPGPLGDAERVSKRNAGRSKGDVAKEQAELKPSIDYVHGKAREVSTLAEERNVELPVEMATDLVELMVNHPIEKAELKDWATQSKIKIDAAKEYIKKEVAKRDAKLNKKSEKDFPEQEAFDIADTGFDFHTNDRHFESKKRRGEKKETAAKEVSKEPTTKEALQSTIKEWFPSVWLNRSLKNGNIQIHEKIADTDLPAEVKGKFDQTKALYFAKDGSIYFFTDNIPKGNELGVVLHEIGEHKGLDNLIGKDRVNQLANRIRAMAEGKGGKLDVKIAKQALEMIKGMEGDRANKELIAYFSEIAVNDHNIKPGGAKNTEARLSIDWITNLWGAIKNALVKLHFNEKDVNAQDVLNLIYGAARLEMGKEGEMGPRREAQPMESKLTAAEEAAMKAKGLTVFNTKSDTSTRQKVEARIKDRTWVRDALDVFGVKMIGPLYSAHRKATEYYGPDGFYTKTTNKIRGTLLMQHTLNAMNFIIPALRNGSMTIDAKGYFSQVMDKTNNIPNLSIKWSELSERMKADGLSPAMVDQYLKTMVFADRYKSLKDKGIKTSAEFTDESYKLGKDLQKKYAKEYQEWRDMYNNIRNNKREFLIKSGLMTSKKVDEFLNRLEYLPLYRMTESEGMDSVFMHSLTSATREQNLKYNTEAFDVGDPMQNIIQNEMWLYQRAMRNHTANRMADEFSEVGLGKFVKARKASDKNVFTILKDGELAHFQVDNPSDAAVFQAAPVVHNAAKGFLSMGARALRRGVTITPSFAYRQMWADVERTWMQSGGERSFLGTLAKSAQTQLKGGLKDTAEMRELENHGVVGQVDIQDGFNRMMQHMMGTHNDTWMGKLETAFEKAERIARNSDMAARMSVYDSVIEGAKKSGRYAIEPEVVQKEAALRAQMMINFNHKGTSSTVRFLTGVVPFINARLQSDWRLVDAIKGNIPGVSKEQAHKMLMMKVGQFAAFTTLYTMIRSGEDDYEDASDENRNRNFLLNVGGVPLKVPVAPEYAFLKSAAEHSYRLITDQEFEDAHKARHAIATGIGNLLVSPTDVLPSMIRPLLENVTNYSFFNDRALVSPTLSTRDVNKQYVEGQTSELAKYISDVGQGMFGNEFNVSPIKIDNVLRGMFGTIGSDVAFTSNLISNYLSESERPTPKLNQIPEIGAVFYDPNGSQRKNDFYNLRDKVVRAHNTLLSLKDDPEKAAEYREKNAVLLRLNGRVNSINNQLTSIRQQKNAMLAKPLSEMDGDQKREALDKFAAREKELLGNRVQVMQNELDAAEE